MRNCASGILTLNPPPLVHHQRFQGPAHVSIERLFDEIRRCLPEPWQAQVAVCPHLSRGFLSRVLNMKAARERAGSINHIVGDVHYLAMALPRKGLVLTIHDCAAMDRLQGIYRELFRQLWLVRPMRRARVVTTISETMRAELAKWTGRVAENIRVIPDCVRGEFIPKPKEFHAEAPVVLQVGTGWNKNVERVADALRGTACRLDIIGKLTDVQRRNLDRSGTSFRELGRVSDHRLLQAYEECDLVVFASIYEGFGLPILEAQATGRPVVTSNFGAMAEAAGKGALLVDPLDVRALREAVIGVCGSSDLRGELINEGFKNVDRYRPERTAAAFAGIYDECSKGPKRHPSH